MDTNGHGETTVWANMPGDVQDASATYVSGIRSLAAPIRRSTQVPRTWKSSCEIENERATHDHLPKQMAAPTDVAVSANAGGTICCAYA